MSKRLSIKNALSSFDLDIDSDTPAISDLQNETLDKKSASPTETKKKKLKTPSKKTKESVDKIIKKMVSDAERKQPTYDKLRNNSVTEEQVQKPKLRNDSVTNYTEDLLSITDKEIIQSSPIQETTDKTTDTSADI
jgi:hypothetical protein